MQAGGEAFDIVPALLVDHHHFVPEIAAVTAIFLGHRRTEQSRLARLAPEFAVDLAIIAPLEDAGFWRVLFIELADRVGEHRDLFFVHEFGLRHV